MVDSKFVFYLKAQKNAVLRKSKGRRFFVLPVKLHKHSYRQVVPLYLIFQRSQLCFVFG